jgi:hypothetical protein
VSLADRHSERSDKRTHSAFVPPEIGEDDCHCIPVSNPRGPNARRAGWIGCNILLGEIPADGKIPMISAGVPVRKEFVREEFSRVKQLA